MNNKLKIKLNGWLAGLLVLLPASLIAQPYGNEWVNFSQTYFRFSIPQTGIYRVTRAELEQAGIPLSNFNPQNVQLFFKGSEIPCYISGEATGLIEYIDFFAGKNDGWFDVGMYDASANQTNPYYSLISDTASVFFTWNNRFDNKRFAKATDQNFSAYTPASYCYVDTLQQYTGQYTEGVADCNYTEAEGWVDNARIAAGQTVTKKLTTPNVIGSSSCTISLALVTYSSGMHHINVTGPGFVTDTIFNGLKTIRFRMDALSGILTNDNTFVFKCIDDQGAVTDYSAASFIRIHYPMSFNFNGVSSKRFTIPASPSKKTYLEITNFSHTGNVLLYDLTGNYLISTSADETTIHALVPESTVETELILIDPAQVHETTRITSSPMVSHSGKNKEYVIVSNRKLWTEAQNYASYRNAYLVDADELYNQFGYGIQKHPQAIHNFFDYIFHNWTTKPQFIFFIGKGVNAVDARKSSSNYSQNLVPPLGHPASDVLLSVGITSAGYEPACPTGRIAASTDADVALYLAKVKEYELNSAAEWMKHALHFGGGNNQYEQITFASYLRQYEQQIEDSLFGGYVSTFLKTSSEPIETSKSDSVTDLINGGVSLMTFFGHGYTNGFDQNIDAPSTYSNQGRYPLLLANSCYSGDIFLPGKASQSEDWVLIADKGAIGFLAMVDEGIPSYLNIFSTQFYKNLAYSDYGKPIGTVIYDSRKAMQQIVTSGLYVKSTIQEFTLHGDPKVVLNSFSLPDLVMDNQSVTFSPSNLTTEIDSFYVKIIIKNLSRSTNQPFIIEVTRTFQDGSTEAKQVQAEGLLYKDTVHVKFGIDRVKGTGNNKFTVRIDALDQVKELNENNNSTSVSTYINSTDLSIIYPYKYSLNPNKSLVLKASTGDPFAKEQISTFQLDTTPGFNSPFLISTDLSHQGGVVEWNPGIDFQIGPTYFWRVAKKASKANDLHWSNSSFTYENGEKGWQQNHFGQLSENTLSFLVPDESTQKFSFAVAPKTLRCHNVGTPTTNTDYLSIGYSIDGIGDISSCGAVGAMLLVVIDSTSLSPWQSDRGDYGQTDYPKCSSRTRPDLYFVFPSTNQGVTSLVNMVENVVPDGYYILIYSFIAGNYQLWSEANTLAFESWGANNVRFIPDSFPYIFFTRKGYPSTSIEVVGESITDVIDLNTSLKGNFTYGNMTTSEIGPSLGWERLSWNYTSLESNPDEVAYVKLKGVTPSGSEVVLKDSITETTMDLSGISAQDYPYVKLDFFTRDETFKTPAQLDYWRIIYQPVSELAINTQRGYEFYNDSLQEGETGKLILSYENVGASDMDSILVNYWIQDKNNQEYALQSKRLSSLKSGEYVTDTMQFVTLNHQGNNNLWVELNPSESNFSGYDQPEQNHFNNYAQIGYYVKSDESNPLLDVTFDGLHIMDGDLVSAQPQIVIQLKDENQYIALDDTSLFSLFIKSQNTGIEEKISLTDNPSVSFVPAQLPQNKAQLIYQAQFPDDGTYELRARGKDATGNETGSIDYVISFKVINESTITNVFNYPNPFSTSTRFVFELTGSEIPDEMRIDIMTITGKVVKVIYQEDLGPLNIGRNITRYAWDGRDMYGDPLAIGVYFYKVYARLSGKTLKMRDTGTNQYFKNGFGKMYLIR